MKLPVGERFFQETKYGRERKLPETRMVSVPRDVKEYENVPCVLLPKPKVSGGAPIWDVVRNRRSVRSYSDRYLDLEELAQLLWATQGITGSIGGYPLRASPSAGALYPIETYLLVNRVNNISQGIYHFNVRKFRLELLKGGNFSYAFAEAALGQHMFVKCAVAFVWSAVIDRCRVKYGERAFRYIFMDVGHICQNLYLAATAMGLGCCAVGAFYDDEVNALIGLDGVAESVVYMATVGG